MITKNVFMINNKLQLAIFFKIFMISWLVMIEIIYLNVTTVSVLWWAFWIPVDRYKHITNFATNIVDFVYEPFRDITIFFSGHKLICNSCKI